MDIYFTSDIQLSFQRWSEIKVVSNKLLRFEVFQLEAINNYFFLFLQNCEDISNKLSFLYLKNCKSLLNDVLNSYDWCNVNIHFRELYSLFSLLKAYLLYRQIKDKLLNNRKVLIKCLKTLDKGLLMGAPIFDNFLSKCATFINNILVSDLELLEKSFGDTTRYYDLNCINMFI